MTEVTPVVVLRKGEARAILQEGAVRSPRFRIHLEGGATWKGHVSREGVVGMIRIVAASMALVLCSARVSADIVVGGGRPATVFVPSSYDPEVPTPLVFLLHGYGTGTNLGASYEGFLQFRPLAESLGFLYLHPDGTLNPCGISHWNGTDACCANLCAGTVAADDSGYLRGIIDEIRSRLNVDSRRIHIMGHSNGAFMAYRMACDHADAIAGIASMAGATYMDPDRCRPSGPVHVLEIHGTADPSVPYAGGNFGGISYPGAIATVERWAMYNGCSMDAEALPPRDYITSISGAETMITRYAGGCSPEGTVDLWTVAGGDHGDYMIGQPAFNSALIEDLLSHPKQPIPRADFIATVSELEVTADGSSSTTPDGTTILSYRWDFGDGGTAEGRIQSHLYERPGRHLITLKIATDDDGRVDRTTKAVEVHCPSGDLSPWTAVDIGAPGFKGGSWMDGDCFSLCAGGSALAGRSDKLQLVYHEMPGNFVLVARIDAMAGSPVAQIGLMARTGLDPGAIMAATAIARTAITINFRFYLRTTTGGSIISRIGEKSAVPGWVKLQRTGDELIGYSSLEAGTWNEVSRMTLAGSPESLFVGLFGIGNDPAGERGFEPLQGRICATIEPDCNGNGVGDGVDFSSGGSKDCTGNGIPDECDIASGTNKDLDANGIPDECVPPGGLSLRGDGNADGTADISDAIHTLEYLFLGASTPHCLAAANANGDGGVDISDPIRILEFLFIGGPAPVPPYPTCGPLTLAIDEELGCVTPPRSCP